MAGQHLSLSTHLVSKWNCFKNRCPCFSADDSHRLFLYINNNLALPPIWDKSLVNQFVLPISIKSNQVLSLTMRLWANGSNKLRDSLYLEKKRRKKVAWTWISWIHHTRPALELTGFWFKKENLFCIDSYLWASKTASCLASSLDCHSRSFLQFFDITPSASPWTKGSASGERGCAVLAEVERRLLVCCLPSVSAHTLWSVPTGLRRNRAQPDRERRQRTSEPQTLGSWPWGLMPRSTDRKHWT